MKSIISVNCVAPVLYNQHSLTDTEDRRERSEHKEFLVEKNNEIKTESIQFNKTLCKNMVYVSKL